MEYIDKIIAQGPYSADWNDIVAHYKPPQWYLDAKFGFYTHWLVSGVPAFGDEWYPRNMYVPGSSENQHQVQVYGPLSPTNGFKEFIPFFNGESFDADEWMKLFQLAGAKFAGPVGEHHDGFPLYNCSLTPYTSVNMGPKRDVAAELKAAAGRLPEKMHFFISSHRAWHFAFYDNGRKWPNSDVNQCSCPSWQDTQNSQKIPKSSSFVDPFYCNLYCPANPNETTPTQAFMKDWLLRTCEMADLYTPAVLYFDWWIGVSPLWQPWIEKLAAFYYNRMTAIGEIGVINTKGNSMPGGADILDYERGQACSIQKNFWQTDTSISRKSWGFINNDTYKSAESIVASLVDIVSKNGAMVLNIGPPPNGSIPVAARDSLVSMGGWLAVAGEAIYETLPYHSFAEGPTQVPCGSFSDSGVAFTKNDFRFTVQPVNSVLNILCMGAVPGDSVSVLALGSARLGKGTVTEVKVLGSKSQVTWKLDSVGLHVDLPKDLLTTTFPPVLTVSGLTDLVWDGVVRQGQDFSIQLDASKIDILDGVSLDVSGNYVTASHWNSTENSVKWTADITQGGKYVLQVLASSPGHARTAQFLVQGNTVSIIIPLTSSATDFALSGKYEISLTAGEKVELVFTVTDPTGPTSVPTGFNLAYVNLVPA